MNVCEKVFWFFKKCFSKIFSRRDIYFFQMVIRILNAIANVSDVIVFTRNALNEIKNVGYFSLQYKLIF